MQVPDTDHDSADDAIRVTEHVWIAMPDGTRLAARIWWPGGQGPFPAILEYIPYRKRDMVRARDERNHPYFAAHGYVCLRVDMRGSGDSEGVMPDMYAQSELDDARAVIAWIAAQDWSSGAVGMFGTSWGGTASLQAAVDAPGPLKAVLANCAAADRFEDDIHWMGGCLLTDSFEWGATLPAILAAPPDSATVGQDWLNTWSDRLNGAAFPLDAWIKHHLRGSYWRHGSVRFEAERLACPVLTIGGWSDRYSNSVMQLVQARPDLCWGIVGPWGHQYPDQGEPGPAMGFQDLALEWWDHWLKGRQNAVADWPRLRLWRREFDPPQDRLVQRNGGWVAICDLDRGASKKYHLRQDGSLSDTPGQSVDLMVPADLGHGACSGDTGYFGRRGGLALEQSPDDARAICFDTPPIDAPVDVIGHPTVTITLCRDRSRAQLAVRLCDVAPDGRSNLVTRHVVNLALDGDLDAECRFSPGEPVSYRLELPSTAYRFAKGHRIRLAIASSYWPLVWPELPLASIKISTGGAALDLPSGNLARQPSSDLPEPKSLPDQPSWDTLSAAELSRTQGLQPDRFQTKWTQPPFSQRFHQTGTTFTYRTEAAYSAELDHSAVECRMDHGQRIDRPDGVAEMASVLRSRLTAAELTVHCHLTVMWNGEVMAARDWTFTYPAAVAQEPVSK